MGSQPKSSNNVATTDRQKDGAVVAGLLARTRVVVQLGNGLRAALAPSCPKVWVCMKTTIGREQNVKT